MEKPRPTKIAELRNRIAFLKRREQKLREMIASSLYSPELRESAKRELSTVLDETRTAVTELLRLEDEA